MFADAWQPSGDAGSRAVSTVAYGTLGLPLSRISPGVRRKRVRVSFRRSVGVALPIIALASGCATTASSTSDTGTTLFGIISGVASPCEGPALSQQALDAIKVRVQLIEKTRVIAVQTVTGSHNYRFYTPTGTYVVRSNQSATIPMTVTVMTGQTRTVNLYSGCM